MRQSLNRVLLRHLVQDTAQQTANSIRLARLLEAHDCAGLKTLFHAFFASIPYQWYTNNHIADYEGFYASVFYSYFAALGYDVAVEESSSHGRLDMAVRTAGHVYLFEFKVAEMAPPRFGPRPVAGAPLRRQVPRRRRADPPHRRRVQPHHPQHHRLRGSRRLSPLRPPLSVAGSGHLRRDSEPDTECAKNLHHGTDARIALTRQRFVQAWTPRLSFLGNRADGAIPAPHPGCR